VVLILRERDLPTRLDLRRRRSVSASTQPSARPVPRFTEEPFERHAAVLGQLLDCLLRDLLGLLRGVALEGDQRFELVCRLARQAAPAFDVAVLLRPVDHHNRLTLSVTVRQQGNEKFAFGNGEVHRRTVTGPTFRLETDTV
jgi:hypothetical protein